MWFRLIFHIKLVTFKILILYELMGRLLLNLVSILFLAHNFLFKLDKFHYFWGILFVCGPDMCVAAPRAPVGGLGP